MINLTVRFEFENYSPEAPMPVGEEIQGKMILTPYESAQGVNVGFELIAEIWGDKKLIYQTIQKEFIAKQEDITSGNTYTYPFTLKNNTLENYYGRTIRIKSRLQALIEKEGKKIGFFEELFEISPRKQSISLDFQKGPSPYEIVEKTPDFTKDSSNSIGNGLGILMLYFFLGIWGKVLLNISINDMLKIGFLLFVLIGIYIGFQHSYKGKMEVNLNEVDSENFQATLYNRKSWKHEKQLEIWYEIIERAWQDGNEGGGAYIETKIYTSEVRFTQASSTS